MAEDGRAKIEDLLYQKKFHEPLFENKLFVMSQEDWNLLDRYALGVVRLSLAKNIAYNIASVTTTYGILKMRHGSSATEHINEFNSNLTRLASVEIKFEDEMTNSGTPLPPPPPPPPSSNFGLISVLQRQVLTGGANYTDTMSKYTPMRFNVEKYDGRINFGLWQVQVKDVLIQSGLDKALKGKPAPVSSKESSAAGKDDDEEWDDLDLRAASAIRLSLAKNVLANVHGISTTKELWEKLKQLYQGKGISNRLYLKEQLILSLPSSYEHMKPILMYGKETLKYADVTGKLLSEEKRLESSGHTSSSEGMFLVCGKGKKKFSQKTPVCWRCGQSGHVKRNCPGGADSVKGSDTANMVSVVDDDTDTMSKYTPMRFNVEKYDGRINFGLWQVHVKDVLIQSGLDKALKGKPAPVSSKESSAAGKDDDEEWDDLDLRAASAIRLSLAKNVLANVHGISTTKELWEKLKQLYQGKGISNRLYLKEQFHTLQTLKYADVTGKLLSEEKRLESSGHTSSSEGMFLVCGKGKKKFSQKTPVCWRCGQSGHVKRNCPGGADSVKGSDTANMVSVGNLRPFPNTNYLDWMRNLRITLRYDNREYVLDEKMSVIDEDSTEEDIAANRKHLEDSNKVSCIMIAAMARQKRLTIVKSLMACKLKEGSSVSIDIILNSLTAAYDGFILTYHMHSVEKTVMELYNMLQTVEAGIKKTGIESSSVTPVLAIQNHGDKKRKHRNPKWKGKALAGPSHGGGNGNSSVQAVNDQKEAVCFYCSVKGHWKRSCPKYLQDLKDGKVNATGSSSGAYMIELLLVMEDRNRQLNKNPKQKSQRRLINKLNSHKENRINKTAIRVRNEPRAGYKVFILRKDGNPYKLGISLRLR
ncbi:hypothetical protein LXL04_039515 [Taraxacum kok-saghyz]